MSMKKILMAAAAVTALAAGVANAATIDNSTKIAGVDLVPAGTTITSNPFTIANELNVGTGLSATGNVVIKPTQGGVGQGQYVITYNITGGTFTTGSIAASSVALATESFSSGTYSAVGTPSSSVASVNTVNANTVAFNVTIASGEFLKTATLTNVLKLGTARATVAIDGNIATSSGNPVDGGAIASKTVVDYRSGYKFTATPATTGTQLSIASGYKKFGSASALASGTADANTASLGTVAFDRSVGADGNDKVYSALTGTGGTGATQSAVGDLTGGTLTLSGDLSAFTPTFGSASPDTGTTNVFTVTPSATATAVTLNPKSTPVAGNAASYSITPVVTIGSGYTAPTFAASSLASITLEGTNYYAAWVGDGTNGINYTIRLGNRTSSAISVVTVSVLNSTATPSATTCSVGPIPASGELVLNSASLKTCFGAFGRADLRITAQVAADAMTAKMRSVSGGIVNEQSLGGGSDVAAAK